MEQKRYPCEHVVPVEQEPRHHLILANEFVRFFVVDIAPHERTLCHHHAHDYLMYVAGDAEIVSAPRAGAPKTLTYHDGDCEVSSAGLVHVVENIRDTRFRNLLVEFLPGVGDLRRGAALTLAQEDVKIRPCFDDQRASVSLLQLENGSQVEISGPAILASPYGSEVEVVAPRSIRVLKTFGDTAWIEPGARAMLRNRARHPARAVSIALGHR